MKKIKALILLLTLTGSHACKDQLDIRNPNQPTPVSAATEKGITSLSQGAVYVNGFYESKFVDGVPGRFWTGAVGFHEIMGDALGVEAANLFLNQLGCPDNVILDNGTSVANPQNPNKQKDLIRLINSNSQQGQNPLFYEWAYMYSMNAALNTTLSLLDGIQFSGDAESRRNTLKAWAYWWKGYAYSRIGSIYYAGIINDEVSKTNGDYKSKEEIIAEAENNFAKAVSALGAITSITDYEEVLSRLIPDICQVGKGGVLSSDEWIRNVNTMRARNILVNTPTAAMTAAQWNSIVTLTNTGIQSSDLVFTARSNATGDIFSAVSGNISAKATATTAGGNTYKVSERLIQDFKVGDQRLANNFIATASWIGNSDRGTIFNTRYTIVDEGAGLAGVSVLSDRTAGAFELYLAGTWEENELMEAEAKINIGGVGIEEGLAIIDAVRDSQGAGLAVVAGQSLTQAQAKEELRRERRVGLAFRGFSFYDARRWGVLDTGRTGCVVLDKAGAVNTNATIQYNFLDYWDVPDNELAYNPASETSAPTMNPDN
jgi:starch-binding outer membrane protein, SusD/RagB family